MAAEHIAGHKVAMNYKVIPSAIFTYPEIATVGVNEQELKEQGVSYKVSKFPFSAIGKAAIGETMGIVKMIADEEGKVLGRNIMGAQASSLIQELTVAVEKGLTGDDLARMVHAHPTLTEAIMEAAGVQGKFWEMHARMFAADNDLETEKLMVYAREVGLDLERFSADLTSPAMESAVIDEYREATKHKIKSPPTLFINSILFDRAHTIENLRNKIDGLLSCID